MDIEQDLRPQVDQSRTIIQKIAQQVQKRQFNRKRVLGLAAKVKEKKGLYDHLTCMAQQSIQFQQKVNIYALLLEIVVSSREQTSKQVEYFAWVIGQIYQMRRNLDASSLSTDLKLKYLSSLLKLVDQIVSRSPKFEAAGRSQQTTVGSLSKLIVQLQCQKQFESLQNAICSLHVLEKLKFYAQSEQIAQLNLIKAYLLTLQQITSYQQKTQEIIVNIAFSCACKFNTLHEDYIHLVQKAPFYVQLLSLEKCRFEEQIILGRFDCQNEEEFELVTRIADKYFRDHESDIKKQLGWFWLKNYANLLLTNGDIELSRYVDQLSYQFLDYLLRILTEELEVCPNGHHRTIVLVVWKEVLLDGRIKSRIAGNQVLFQSVELLLFRFLRETINQLPCTLEAYQVYLVLSVFAQYCHSMLRQKQCQELRGKVVTYYINNYLQLLSALMLLKQEYLSSEQNSSLIDLSHYNCDLLAGLVSQPGVSAEAVLLRVNKEVGKVLIRYLSQMGSPDLQHCLRRDRVVDYVIENNIELHDDQVDYALHEKLANNIQKYMAIIRSFQIKNRYQHRVNAFIVDLLSNEVDSLGKVKLLPSSFSVFIYIIEKMEELCSICQEKGLQTSKLISCLYALAQRSLYEHVPDAIYLLVLAINQMKVERVQQQGLLQQQLTLLNHLIKFCCHYSSHGSYSFLGYATILLILYGPAYSAQINTPQNSINELLLTQGYFLDTLNQLLEKQAARDTHHTYRFQRKPSQIPLQLYQNCWQVLRKNLLYGLMKNLQAAAHNSFSTYRAQIFNQRRLIQQIVTKDINKEKLHNSHSPGQGENNGKRMKFFSRDQGESDLQEDQSGQQMNQQGQKVERNAKVSKGATYLEKLVQKGIQFNEFQPLRDIEAILSRDSQEGGCYPSSQLFPNSATVQRVHGKIRSIVHVKRS